MLLNCCQSSCHLKSEHHWSCYCFSDNANKSHFISCLLILIIKLGEVIYVSVLFEHSPAHFNNTVIILITVIILVTIKRDKKFSYRYIPNIPVYIYIYRGGTVHVFVPNRHGTGISVRCMRPYYEYRQFTPNPEGGATAMHSCLITASRRTVNANGDTEAATLMFGSLYFILIKYQLVVKLALLELMCVCVRDHFNCFLIQAESTFNTYCLINNHCIKVCFYLCTLTMKTKQILYI